MNREMRRLQAKEEERAKKRRQERSRPGPGKKERTSPQQFLKEVRQELKKVAWPSRQELLTYTAVVFLVTTVLTLYIFALDWFFTRTIFDFLEQAAT